MKEIKLSRPIKINGVETDVLKIVKEELLVEDMLRISKATSDPMEQDVHMLAYITETSPEDLKKLNFKDYRKAQAILKDFLE
jgi:hypothetical protein